MTVTQRGSRSLGAAYCVLAALAWSLAGILQRQLRLPLPSQIAGRAAFGIVGIFVFVAIAERGRVLPAFRAIGRAGLAVAALLAVSSASFIAAIGETAVANVVVIQALVPLVAALLGRLLGDPVRPRTWVAMGVALAGCAVVAGAPTRPDLVGTILSLVSMVSFATAIVVARHRADVSMAPATCLAQVLVLAVFAPFASFGAMGGASLGWLALLGVVQMGLGLFLVSLAARLLPAAEVAVITQVENVLGPLWVWLAGLERPAAATIVGGLIVIGAVVVQITRRPAARSPDAGDRTGSRDEEKAPA